MDKEEFRQRYLKEAIKTVGQDHFGDGTTVEEYVNSIYECYYEESDGLTPEECCQEDFLCFVDYMSG